MKDIVFTGTREGMTSRQHLAVGKVLVQGVLLRHGCCRGSDVEAGQLWIDLKGSCQDIIGYPSTSQSTRVDCPVGVRHPEAPPLERNKTMINHAKAFAGTAALCVAAPKGMREELRSGTWACIRYALKRKVQVTIVWPDGSVTEDFRRVE